MILVGVVQAKDFLPHSNSIGINVYSNFKARKQGRTIGQLEDPLAPAFRGRYGTVDVIRKPSLPQFGSEAGVIANAAHEIKIHEATAHLSIDYGYDLRSHVGRIGTNVDFADCGLVRREDVRFEIVKCRMVAQVMLLLGGLGPSRILRLHCVHHSGDVDGLGDGMANILYRQLQVRNCPVVEKLNAFYRHDVNRQPWSLLNLGGFPRLSQLVLHCSELKKVDRSDNGGENQSPQGEVEGIGLPEYLHLRIGFLPLFVRLLETVLWFGLVYLCGRLVIVYGGGRRPLLWFLAITLMAMSAAQFVKSALRLRDNLISVTRKPLTTCTLCNTVSLMANVLSAEKQTAIIAALAEGSSIRSIERITGIHRDTIMRLGVKVGQGCTRLMDSKMQDLDCNFLQFDELWGFIGKKERHCSVDDSPELGDVWTFCAIDSETKLVPSFKVGKRTHATTTEFVQDVASRMRHRVQVSSDAMHLYVEAMELAFGADVDYGQIVKVYTHDSAHHPERQYSAPRFASAYRRPITGNPEMELVSTSHVERLNATTRLHMRRLTRLTLAFSKKLENFGNYIVNSLGGQLCGLIVTSNWSI